MSATQMRRDGRINRRRVLQLYRRGVDPRDIARQLGLHRNTVLRHLRLAGIPRLYEAKRYAPTWEMRVKRPPYWGLRVKHGSREVVLGRKFCSVCGRWRPVSDYDMLRGRLTARCHLCGNASRRYYHAHNTPEQRALELEYQRIWKEGKRRANGSPIRLKRQAGYRNGSAIDQVERIMLPREPLAREIERWLADGENRTLVGLGRMMRPPANDHSLRRILTGESHRVQIDLADRVAVAIGVPSSVIWGGQW